MKLVLRHQTTGRYYSAAGAWVRRADNALAFDNAAAARDYLRSRRISRAQAVYRLAPFLIPLVLEHEQQHSRALWENWWQARSSRWYFEHVHKFDRN